MNSKIKILHIIKSLGRGGAEMLLPETLRLHNREKFEFQYMFFLPWKDQMERELKDQGVIVVCMPARNNVYLLLKAREVANYVRENGIDIIHAHLPWAGIMSRMVSKLTGVPVIYTEHNKQERYHRATRFMNLKTMNWTTRVIAVSRDVEQSIRRHKRQLSTTVQTILNGVNTNRFSPGNFSGKEIKRQFQIPDDAPVVGTIAVFRFQKRLDVWIDVAAQILQRNPEAHFIVVGDGPLRDLVAGKVRESHLGERIHFAGVQTEVRPYLAAFDVFMMSSIFEGLPIALLEAMASGCPVVATAAGGIKEVIRPSVDGLLCDVEEPFKLVDLCVSLLADDQKRRVLADAGRERVADLFSMDKMVRELEDTYRNVAFECSN